MSFMNKSLILTVLVAIVLSACEAPAAVPPTAILPTATPAFTATPQLIATLEPCIALQINSFHVQTFRVSQTLKVFGKNFSGQV